MNLKAIYAQANRGVLLDVVVFMLNLILMRRLTESFVDIVTLASADDLSTNNAGLVCRSGCVAKIDVRRGRP
jgi:hypothetical protein